MRAMGSAGTSLDERKKLSERVHAMGRTEQLQIFRILTSSGIKHTRNSNGCFFDITKIGEDVVARLLDCMRYCDRALPEAPMQAPLQAPLQAPPQAPVETPRCAGAVDAGAPVASECTAAAGPPPAPSSEGTGASTQAPEAPPLKSTTPAANAAPGPPRYINERVRQFINCISRSKAENTANRRRETSRFHHLRKKYSKPLPLCRGPVTASNQEALFEELDTDEDEAT